MIPENTDTILESVIETAVRLYGKHGAQVGAWKARQFARWSSRGSANRQFWLAVAESIQDAAPMEG